MKNIHARIRRSVLALVAAFAMLVGGAVAAQAANTNCYGSSFANGTTNLKVCQDIVYKAGQLKVSFVPQTGWQLTNYAHAFCRDSAARGWTKAQTTLVQQQGQKKAQAIAYGASRHLC